MNPKFEEEYRELVKWAIERGLMSRRQITYEEEKLIREKYKLRSRDVQEPRKP